MNEVNRIAREKRTLQDGLPDDRMALWPVTWRHVFLDGVTRSKPFPEVTASNTGC